MSDNTKLDEFAALLMDRVRDRSIRVGDAIIKGRMEVFSKDLQAIVKSLSQKQFEYVQELVPEIVDQTLHFLLWFFEEEPNIKISTTKNNATDENLLNIGNGKLESYLLDWIKEFSKERLSPAYKRFTPLEKEG
jgi:hypothetical protein